MLKTLSWGLYSYAAGDGKVDAVVIGTIVANDNNKKTNNGMFKWTGANIEPMMVLADKVGVHEGIADIKRLGK